MNYFLQYLLLLACSLQLALGQQILGSEEAQAAFEQALTAQQARKPQEALQLYKELEKQGYSSSELLANMGLAYSEIEEPGQAALYLERALRQNPKNYVARQNLKALRQKLEKPIVPEPDLLLIALVKGLRTSLSANTWAWLFACSFFLALFAFASPFLALKKQLPYPKTTAWTSMGLAFLLFLPLGLWQSAAEAGYPKAVVMQKEIGLRNAPSYNGEEITIIGQGNSLWIEEELQESWYKVRLDNGFVGWLPAQSIEII